MIPSSTCPSWQHDIPAQPDILVALISYTTGGTRSDVDVACALAWLSILEQSLGTLKANDFVV